VSGILKVKYRNLAVICSFFLVSACASLPIQGPERVEISKTNENNNLSGFILVDVNRDVARVLQGRSGSGVERWFKRGRPASTDLLGPGDVLNISIWENDPNGLFSSGQSPTPGGGLSRGLVSGIEIDRKGYIQFPYVGRISTIGVSTNGLSRRIRNALSKQTNNPQVHIERIKKSTNVVTIVGGVKTPGVYPIGPSNDKLLDALAVSGGALYPNYETKLTLTRLGQMASIYLDDVVSDSRKNTYLRPRDEVSIERKPKYFLAFGAVAKKDQIEFGQSKLTVLEALAKARGLDDELADPTGIFLFRFESRKTLADFGRLDDVADGVTLIPVIYRFNLRDANQYFYAKAIGVHSKDAIYVANASSVQVSKFMKILGQAVGIGITTAGSVRAFN